MSSFRATEIPIYEIIILLVISLFGGNLTITKAIVTTPIFITGDSDLQSQTLSNGWTGSGTFTDPIVITGINIGLSSGQSGLVIKDTTLHVHVDGGVISGGENGVVLSNVKNVNLDSLVISDSGIAEILINGSNQ